MLKIYPSRSHYWCFNQEKISGTSHNALLPMGLLAQVLMWIVSDETAQLSEFILILHFRYVLSLTIHITTCTKYPIGSNALWEGPDIFLLQPSEWLSFSDPSPNPSVLNWQNITLFCSPCWEVQNKFIKFIVPFCLLFLSPMMNQNVYSVSLYFRIMNSAICTSFVCDQNNLFVKYPLHLLHSVRTLQGLPLHFLIHRTEGPVSHKIYMSSTESTGPVLLFLT